MINLKPRHIDLIKSSISNENVTVKDFAEIHNISTRTVYREIDNINKFLEKYKVKIANTVNGLVLRGNDKAAMDLKLQLIGFNTGADSAKRKSLIAAELLQCKEPIKIQYFAAKFNVSSSTISNYIKDIKRYLEDSNVNLISKPGVGVYIEGDEKDIRHAIIDLLYKNYNINQLAGFIQNDYKTLNYEKKTVDNLNDRLLNIVDYKTISVVEKALANLEKAENYQMDDRLYIELSVHLSLAIKRLQNNEKITLDSLTLNNLKKFHEYKLARIIADYIEKEMDLKIPEEEIGYITIHLQSTRIGSSLSIDEKYLYSLTDNILRRASETFNINFENDSTLRKDLSMHLSYSIYRLKSGYEKIRNPILEEIKNQYDDVFKKCNKVLDVMRRTLTLDISEDEVGYITMHFAAALERMKYINKKYDVLLVCASGIGTSRMLAAKLRNIKQINVVAVSSVLKIDEVIAKQNIDLIISTIPIVRNDLRIIVVNPFFTENDIKKLEQELNIDIVEGFEAKKVPVKTKLKNIKDIGQYGYEINVIIKNTFFTEIKGNNVQDIMKELLNEGIVNGLISLKGAKNIKSILEKREKLGTIILPNKKFAIFHCASSDISQSMITVGKLKKPITLINLMDKKEKVNTVFLMIAPENNKRSLEAIGDLSGAIITEEGFIDKLTNSSSLEQCKALIEETLLKNLYKQILRSVV